MLESIQGLQRRRRATECMSRKTRNGKSNSKKRHLALRYWSSLLVSLVTPLRNEFCTFLGPKNLSLVLFSASFIHFTSSTDYVSVPKTSFNIIILALAPKRSDSAITFGTALFWVITQRVAVIYCRRFGKNVSVTSS